MRRSLSPPALALLCMSPQFAVAQDEQVPAPKPVPERLSREDVYAPIDRAAAYLVREQNEDGSWGNRAPECLLELGFALETYYSWQLASQGLCCMALASLPETAERKLALERAVNWLCDTDLPIRDSDWDIDYVWSSLYGFVACIELAQDERLQQEPWKGKIRKRGEEFLGVLLKHQALSGGWAYYDDPPFDVRPSWATSFCTALILPYLVQGKADGYPVEDKVIRRAQRYLEMCALPNGAYSYDLSPVTRISGVESINLMEGSLGRTQVGNWALRKIGVERITDDLLREGLESFFKNHGFLDHVRTRPIPHEGFHANAGYFYFFAHYYAAQVIDLLPEEEREAWHARLRPHLVKTQWRNGALSDFLDSSYLVNASTSFFVLSLRQGLEVGAEEGR